MGDGRAAGIAGTECRKVAYEAQLGRKYAHALHARATDDSLIASLMVPIMVPIMVPMMILAAVFHGVASFPAPHSCVKGSRGTARTGMGFRHRSGIRLGPVPAGTGSEIRSRSPSAADHLPIA